MVFERHRRRERPEALDLGQDLGAEDRVRLHHLALAAIERARLPQDVQRNARLADVVQQRRLRQRAGQLLVEPELLADQQTQGGDVHGMAVGQVLVQLDREDLAERRAAARNLRTSSCTTSRTVRRLTPFPAAASSNARSIRKSVSSYAGIERAGGRVGPLRGAPPRVERNQPAQADVMDVLPGQALPRRARPTGPRASATGTRRDSAAPRATRQA